MEWKTQLMRIGKALLVSAVLTGLLLLLTAWILYKMNLSGLAENVMVILIYVLACLAGGFILGKQEEKRRFLWGAGFGALYFLVLFLLMAVFSGSAQAVGEAVGTWTGVQSGGSAGTGIDLAVSWGERIRVLVICLLAGMAGGMLS